MKKLLLLTVLSILSFCSYSQNILWAKSFGGTSNDAGRVTCTDPSGNVIVAGNFSGLSMQIGSVSVNGSGGGDLFLSKFDPDGNLMWLQAISGASLEIVKGVCTSTNGSIFLCGSYNSPVLSIGSTTLGQNSNSGYHDMFVASFLPSGGLIWTQRYGGIYNDYPEDITYSSTLNNILVCGYYNSPTLTIGSSNLINTSPSSPSSNNDVFVARFNATTGTANNCFSTGANTSDDMAFAVRTFSNDIYIGGTFNPASGTSTSVIGAAVTSFSTTDVFLAKYSSTGVFNWVRTAGSAGSSNQESVNGVEVDNSGNVYMTGSWFNVGNFGMTFSTTVLPNSGQFDGYVAKYTSAGAFTWANRIGGTAQEFINNFTIDNNNDLYLTGYFTSTASVMGSLTLTPSFPGASDPFIVKVNGTNGSPVWGITGKNNTGATSYAITSDLYRNIYFTGSFAPGNPLVLGTNSLSTIGSNDGYIAKIACLTTTISSASSSLCAGSSLTLTASGATSYTWSNGAIGNPIVVSPTVAATTYTVLGASGTCTGTGNAYSVTVLPAFVNAGANFSLQCGQAQAFNVTTVPTAISSVSWFPASNLSSATVLNPTITGSGAIANYTVTVNFSNGCTKRDVIVVNPSTQTPSICMVTTDSMGVNNEVYWEKALYNKVDSFIIYRETSSNVFKRIGAVPKNAPSFYKDTARSIGPNNGDPRFTSYKYKLQIRDTCGNYSAQSLWHQTIFVQDQQNGNFNWNPYAIESTTASPVANYTLKRYDVISGVTTTLASTSSFLLSDPQYTTIAASGNVKWYVDAVGFNCNVTLRTLPGTAALKNRTKSNNVNERQFPVIGLNEYALDVKNLVVYPNPAATKLTIILPDGFNSDGNIDIVSILGQTVLRTAVNPGTSGATTLDINPLSKGIYFVRLSSEGKLMAITKLIKE